MCNVCKERGLAECCIFMCRGVGGVGAVHSQDIHKHSTTGCDQHDVSINLVVLVDDPENGFIDQHSCQ